MNDNGYDELKMLYRAAREQEGPSRADRLAVRMAVAAATAAAVQATATAASAATAGLHTAANSAFAANGAAATATGAAATATGGVVGTAATAPAVAALTVVGTKGVVVQGLLAGKFLSGLLIGATLGTAVSVTTQFIPSTSRTVTAAATHSERPTTRAKSPRLHSNASPIGASTPSPLEPPKLDSLPLEPAKDVDPPVAIKRPSAAHESAVSGAAPNQANALRLNPAEVAIEPTQPTADRLMRETEALARVQAALAGTDPDAALALLDEQDRNFPKGQLEEERAAARALALCDAGRLDEAKQARARFEQLHPNSPLTKRVQSSCEK
jgi:hypothetical protein